MTDSDDDYLSQFHRALDEYFEDYSLDCPDCGSELNCNRPDQCPECGWPKPDEIVEVP